jgi:hypothetical protein
MFDCDVIFDAMSPVDTMLKVGFNTQWMFEYKGCNVMEKC